MSQEISQENGEKVRAFYDAFIAGDIAEVFKVNEASSHPDSRLHEAESLPYGGVYVGQQGVMEAMGQIAKYVPDTRGMAVDHIIADGDNVVVILRIPWLPPGQTEPIEMLVSEWYQFEDGRITDVRPFLWDTAVAAGRWSPGDPKD
jgi:hypothetical protein